MLIYPYRNPSRNPTVKKQPAWFHRSLVYEPYHDSIHKLLRKIKTGICIWDPGFSDLFRLESLTSVKHGFPLQKPHWHLPAEHHPSPAILSSQQPAVDQGSSPPLWKVNSKGAAFFLHCPPEQHKWHPHHKPSIPLIPEGFHWQLRALLCKGTKEPASSSHSKHPLLHKGMTMATSAMLSANLGGIN